MTSCERPSDEMANLVTHAIGLLLSLLAVVLLMYRVAHSSSAMQIACGIYSISLVLLYASSTLSHLFHDMVLRRQFRTLDQACIFLLIAGTYTPLAVIYLNHGWWPIVLIIMWLSAFAGVVRVIQVRDLSRNDKFAFGVLGLFPIVTLFEFSQRAPLPLVAWVIAGGALYLIGTVFLSLSARIRYTHAAWHVFVIAGSTCHYVAILQAITSLCGQSTR